LSRFVSAPEQAAVLNALMHESVWPTDDSG
jgi:hypothetical protein